MTHIANTIISGASALVNIPFTAIGAMKGIFCKAKSVTRLVMDSTCNKATAAAQAVAGTVLGPKVMEIYHNPTETCNNLLSPIISNARHQFVRNRKNSAVDKWLMVRHITNENVKSVVGLILLNATDIIQNPTQKSENYILELLSAKKRVHQNICSLLKMRRKELKLFTLDHLIAFLCFLSVKYFKKDLHVLRILYKEGMASLQKLPELNNELEAHGDGELLFLNSLEKATNHLLNNTHQFTDEQIDQKWGELVLESRPFIDQLVSSKTERLNPLASKSVETIFKLFGDPSSILSRIQPSKIIDANFE